jgi:hypothetical protein
LTDMMSSWLAYEIHPFSLFLNNEPGAWYDPSDLTTMFQDRAGTTPVTAAGQSVGLRLDKSKGLELGPELVTNGTFDTDVSGWTAVNATLSVVSGELRITKTNSNGQARQTLTTIPGKSYQVTSNLTDAVDAGNNLRIAVGTSAGQTNLGQNFVANGITSASLPLIFTATGTSTFLQLYSTSSTGYIQFDNISVRELKGNHAVANSDAARGIYGIEPVGGRRNLLLATTTMATQNVTVAATAHTLSFTGTGTVTLSGVSTAGPLVGTGANDRVSLTFTPTAGTLTLTVTGSVTLAQLETGSTATNYQRVTTQYDVTEAGVPSLHYVQYDGADDGYVTPTITPNTDKVQVFAGVRKLSDAATGMVVEFSADAGGNNGSFWLAAPDGAGAATYNFRSRGTTARDAQATSLAAPRTNVLAGLGDISGDRSTLRVNGVQAAQSTADQGTGNFLAYPLYIGRRGGTSLPFNGRDYGLIVRFGPNLDANTISNVEKYLAQKTGVTL